jgi:hypothetical protein
VEVGAWAGVGAGIGGGAGRGMGEGARARGWAGTGVDAGTVQGSSGVVHTGQGFGGTC